MSRPAVRRRINITLPEETVRLIESVAAKGARSRLIAEAVRSYVAGSGRAELRRRLKEGALERADRDRALVNVWFVLDEEVWRSSRR